MRVERVPVNEVVGRELREYPGQKVSRVSVVREGGPWVAQLDPPRVETETLAPSCAMFHVANDFTVEVLVEPDDHDTHIREHKAFREATNEAEVLRRARTLSRAKRDWRIPARDLDAARYELEHAAARLR